MLHTMRETTGKYGPEKTSYSDTFYPVMTILLMCSNCLVYYYYNDSFEKGDLFFCYIYLIQ